MVLGNIKSASTIRIAHVSGSTAKVENKYGAWTVGGDLYVGENATGTLVVTNGGSVTTSSNLYIGYGANSKGTLTINDGMVEVASSNQTYPAYNSASASGMINLNSGGVLKTTRIAQRYGSGTVNFNGGTLQANASHADFIKNGITVNIGEMGGGIDNNGYNISISTPLVGKGSPIFRGTGKTTLTNAVSYSGMTYVESGTTLVTSNATAKSNIIKNGLVVVGIPTEGATIFTHMSALTAEDVAKVSCPLAPDTIFTLSADSKSIIVESEGTLLANYWTGEAGDNNLSTAENWSNGVPTGNATIFCTVPATLTVGNTFAPSSITFAAGCAPITVNGSDLSGIVAVTNLSSVSHTINAKVFFAGNIQVLQPAMGGTNDLVKAHITFAGGAYAAEGCALESANVDPTYSRCIFGKYVLENAEGTQWTASASSGQRRVCLANNSTMYVPYAGNVSTIYIGTNANLVVGSQSANGRLSYRNYGEMVVSNLTATTAAGNDPPDIYVTYGQGTSSRSVFKFGTVTNAMTGSKTFRFADTSEKGAAAEHVFYIGKGGINYGDSSSATVYYLGRDTDGNYDTIRPWDSDFTIGARPGGGVGIRLLRDVEFCTDDESGTGRTITMDAITCAQNTPALTVSGSGTLKVNKEAQNSAQPPITLKGTATLEYATATATLGTGTVTLGAGTTFAFQNATAGGVLSLPSTIALPTGENEKATLRINGEKLKLFDDHVILASGATEDSDNHLTVTGDAIGEREPRLKVEGGKLILNVIPKGVTFLIL